MHMEPAFFYTLNYAQHSDHASRMEYADKFKKLISCSPQHKLYILCHKSMHDVCMQDIDENENNKLITVIWMPDEEFVTGNDIQLGKNINKYIDLLN